MGINPPREDPLGSKKVGKTGFIPYFSAIFSSLEEGVVEYHPPAPSPSIIYPEMPQKRGKRGIIRREMGKMRKIQRECGKPGGNSGEKRGKSWKNEEHPGENGGNYGKMRKTPGKLRKMGGQVVKIMQK